MTATAQPDLYYIANDEFVEDARIVAQKVAAGAWAPDFVIGIGRGGLVPAVYISHQLNVPMLSIDQSSKVPGFAEELLGKVAVKSAGGERLLFVDDINDSGGTIESVRRILAEHGCATVNLRFAVLMDNIRSRAKVDYRAQVIDRNDDKRWFVFPWEAVGARADIVAEARSVPERLG